MYIFRLSRYQLSITVNGEPYDVHVEADMFNRIQLGGEYIRQDQTLVKLNKS
jgi:hypothetical protein